MNTKWRKRLRWSIIIFFLVLFLIYYIPRAYRGTIEVTVIDKERITYQEDGQTKSKYLVYTDEEVFENTQNNYINGLATLTELIDAENAMADAKNNYSNALLEYKLAEIQLIKSQGKLKSLSL